MPTPPQKLTRREREIMDILFALGQGAAEEIRERLTEPPSYSAVRTMLARLEAKGQIRHHEEGLRYVYGTAAAAPGIGLVPHSSLTASIDARLSALNTQFATYLGAAPLSDTSAPAGANGLAIAASLRSLSRLGVAGMGPDSLSRMVKIGTGEYAEGPTGVTTRLPREVGRVERDAVTADPGARVERHEPERLGGGRLDDLPGVDALLGAERGELVDERDVDHAEGVLEQLRHLGRTAPRDRVDVVDDG